MAHGYDFRMREPSAKPKGVKAKGGAAAAVKRMSIERAEGGGHTVQPEGGEPKKFGPGEGAAALAHIAQHMGIKAPAAPAAEPAEAAEIE